MALPAPLLAEKQRRPPGGVKLVAACIPLYIEAHSASGYSTKDQPKEIWLAPPGGASTREELRSVMKFPTFWPSGRL